MVRRLLTRWTLEEGQQRMFRRVVASYDMQVPGARCWVAGRWSRRLSKQSPLHKQQFSKLQYVHNSKGVEEILSCRDQGTSYRGLCRGMRGLSRDVEFCTADPRWCGEHNT